MITSFDFSEDPLLCPRTLLEVSDIVGLDLQSIPFCVAPIVHRLYQYLAKHSLCGVALSDFRILLSDLKHVYCMCKATPSTDCVDCSTFDRAFVDGRKNCDNCFQNIALQFCFNCLDHFCPNCFDGLHSTGNRVRHSNYRIHLCSICNLSVAKLEVPRTQTKFCQDCYAFKIVPLQNSSGYDCALPERIDFPDIVALTPKDERRPHEEWIPFFDKLGFAYFFNFKTMESYRHKFVREIRDDHPIPQEASDVLTRMSKYNRSL